MNSNLDIKHYNLLHLALNYTLLSTRPCSLNSKHTTLAATFNLAGLSKTTP